MTKTDPTTAALDSAGAGDFHAGMSLGALARVISASGCFGKTNPNIAAVKILAGRDLGLGPVEAMRGLHLFDGKIELGSGVMSSKIKGSGRYDYDIVQHDKDGCVIECWEMNLRTDEWQQRPNISFTRVEAEKAGLLKKPVWSQYFDDMTFSRCMSRFFRRYCPHLAGGAVYGDGEISDPADGPPQNGGPRGGKHEPAPIAPKAIPEDSPEDSPAAMIDRVMAESPPAGEEPAVTSPTQEHPYGQFCREAGELKEKLIAHADGEAAYRKVFQENGRKGRADVPKGATILQREIVQGLQLALKQAEAFGPLSLSQS